MNTTTKLSLLIILLVGMVAMSPMAVAERTIEVELDSVRQITDAGHRTAFYSGYVEVRKDADSVSRAIYGGNFQELTRTDITKAEITLPRYLESFQIGDLSDYTISIHRIEEPWSYWDETIVWENMPMINLSDGVIGEWVENPNGEWLAEKMPVFNVTGLLTKGPRYGFVVKLTNESGEDARSVFYDHEENSPMLTVTVSSPAPPEVPEDMDKNGLYPTDLIDFMGLDDPMVGISELGGFENNYIEAYLSIHGESPNIPGDVDGDRCVDYEDALEIVDAINNNHPYNPLMDINDDGFITERDISALEMLVTFPGGSSSPGPEVADFNEDGRFADCGDWEIILQHYREGTATKADLALMRALTFEVSYLSEIGDENFRMKTDNLPDNIVTYTDWVIMRPYAWVQINSPITMTTANICVDTGIDTSKQLSFSFSDAEAKGNNKGGNKAK